MKLNKIRLKSAFMMIYSISYWLLFIFLAFITIYTFINNVPEQRQSGIGFVLIMSFLAVLVIVIFALVSYLIAFLPTKDSDDYWLVTSGLELLKRKYKFVSHSELGYFILIFDGHKAKLYEVNWFSLKHIMPIDMYDYEYDQVRISNRIKSFLDDLYQIRLAEIRRKEVIKNNTNKLVTKWDGHLDVVSRRDSKIDQLLK